MQNRKTCRSAVIVMAALLAGGAPLSHAQSVLVGNSTAPTAESPEQGSLEEVTVTAQLRGNERLLDTPISIGVIPGAVLDTGSARGVSDALSNVGGVSIIETQPGETNIAVRGIVGGTFGAPTTGYYLDEVPFAFIDQTQSPDANAFDLQRVEVLRGPQGTLFGASAMGGVVRILTNDADLNEFQSKVRTSGSYTDGGRGNYEGDLMINAPLIPGVLAIRSVASYSDLSGFIGSALDGAKRINDSQLQSYRLKIDAQPTDGLSIKLGYTHSRIDNGAPSYAFENLETPFTSDQADSRSYDTYNLIAQYDASTFSVLSSTSYLNYLANSDSSILLDDTTPFAYFNHYGLESVSQEVRLTSNLHGEWQWSAGAFYKSTKEHQVQTVADPAEFPFPYTVHIRSESAAIFGELTRKLGDRLELTGGLRYFHDDQLNVQESNFFPGPLAPPTAATFDHVTGRVILKYNPDDDHMIYGSVATGFRSGLNQSAAVLTVDPNFAPLKPDSLITYEIGSKAKALDGRLSFDTALYYTHWTGVQQSLELPNGFVAYVNAGEASGLGVDTGIQYQVTADLSLQGSVGWNGLKFQQNVLQAGSVLFAEGTRLNEAPEFTATLSSVYHFPIGIANVRGVFGTALNYTSSEILRDLNGTLLTSSESANIFRAGSTLGVEADHWSSELYADNIFNNREALTPPDIIYGSQSIRLRPRTIGLRTNYRF
jgi:iron complex outermembrane recepter protein